MKISFSLLIALTLCGFLCAQTKDPIVIIVEYKLTHIIDSTQPGNPYIDNFLLLAGKQSSWYDKYAIGIKKIGRAPAPGTTSSGIPLSAFTDQNKASIYKSIEKHSMFTELVLGKVEYVVSEELPLPEWKITLETKNLGGYLCQKATTRFKGRNYEAWFTNKLPYRTGPWKFGGLPGLILEIGDEKKEVLFNFVSFYTASEGMEGLSENRKGIRISAERYRKIMTAIDNDPAALNNSGGGTGNLVAISVPIGGSLPTMPKPRKINNPIEKNDQ